MESRRLEINMQPLGSAQTKVPTENWTESFQDLQSWCHQPHQDELHTPQVINNDEFNFSTDVYNVKDLDEPSLVDPEGDPWGNDIFGTCQTLGEENNNNNNDTFTLTKLPYSFNNSKKMYQLNNFIPNVKSPLKPSSEDVLLSQSSLQQPLKVEVVKNTLLDYQQTSSPYLEHGDVRIKEGSLSHFKIPIKGGFVERKERPKLQLNITAATTAATNRTNPNISLRTPDVLQPVLDASGCDFDLVRFLDPGDEFPTLVSQSCDNVNTLTKDHDYTESWPGRQNEWRIKSEPLSPVAQDEKTIVIEHQYNKAAIPEVVKTESGRPVKRPRKDSSSDYVFDSDAEFSDESAEWSPRSSKKKGRPKKKKERIKRETSDAESVTFDKYRELRDRNNEASRRSRFNRKQRDYEMRMTADKLEKDNMKLKRRAERMEKLVEELRATIMKSVTSRNVQNNRA